MRPSACSDLKPLILINTLAERGME